MNMTPAVVVYLLLDDTSKAQKVNETIMSGKVLCLIYWL